MRARERERGGKRENYSFFLSFSLRLSLDTRIMNRSEGWRHRNVSKLGRSTISQSRNSPIKCKCLFMCSAGATDVYRCACIKLTPSTCDMYHTGNKIAWKRNFARRFPLYSASIVIQTRCSHSREKRVHLLDSL